MPFIQFNSFIHSVFIKTPLRVSYCVFYWRKTEHKTNNPFSQDALFVVGDTDKPPSNYKCNESYNSEMYLKKGAKKRGPLTLTGEVRNNFIEDMILDLGLEQ